MYTVKHLQSVSGFGCLYQGCIVAFISMIRIRVAHGRNGDVVVVISAFIMMAFIVPALIVPHAIRCAGCCYGIRIHPVVSGGGNIFRFRSPTATAGVGSDARLFAGGRFCDYSAVPGMTQSRDGHLSGGFIDISADGAGHVGVPILCTGGFCIAIQIPIGREIMIMRQTLQDMGLYLAAALAGPGLVAGLSLRGLFNDDPAAPQMTRRGFCNDSLLIAL